MTLDIKLRLAESTFRPVLPAIGLFFLALFVAEYLLGDFPRTELG